jgi:hypothetical protein
MIKPYGQSIFSLGKVHQNWMVKLPRKAYPADIIAAEPTEWLEWDYDDSHLDVIDRHHGSILPGLVIC